MNVDRIYEVFTGVSVPSRGAIFLNSIEKLEAEIEELISVPSRGAIFLNKEVGMVSSEDMDFRPLSGSYIS